MREQIRVGLIGYGRAGKAVARVLDEADDIDLRWIVRRFGHANDPVKQDKVVSASIDELTSGRLQTLYPVDVVVDFSAPEAISAYGRVIMTQGVAIVSAISNYPAEMQLEIELISRNTAVMCSPNITLGINYLLVAAQLLQHIAPFTDVEIIEEHFRDKVDCSGTAIRIADALGLDNSKINSIRVGGIVGHHEVVFGFPFQTVRLVHDSISREAFGTGALFALRKLYKRPPGLYTYESLLREAMLEVLLLRENEKHHASVP